MSEWITDRRPTSSDAPYRFQVWTCEYGVPAIEHYSNVREGLAWMKLDVPVPYQPPQPDTSLAASIERMEKLKYSKCSTGDKECDCANCDQKRILEAAKKWEATCRGTAKMLAAQANDPDGVGDGWRLIDKSVDVPTALDEAKYRVGWGPVSLMCLHTGEWGELTYRRRIDSDKQEADRIHKGLDELRKTALGVMEQAESEHDDIGESEAGRKYQERVESCVGRQRREWWICVTESKSDLALRHDDPDYEACGMPLIHVREVLPGYPDPEWVAELIRLCDEAVTKPHGSQLDSIARLRYHMAKRGEK